MGGNTHRGDAQVCQAYQTQTLPKKIENSITAWNHEYNKSLSELLIRQRK